MKLSNNLFKARKVNVYDTTNHAVDSRKNLPNNYRLTILRNSISGHIYRNNQMWDFITYVQDVVANWVDAVNSIKVYKSFTVKKDYKNVK